MANRKRWTTLCCTLAAVLTGLYVGAAAAERPTLLLQLDDRAGVERDNLAGARAQVERVFRAAGVEIEWTNEPSSRSTAAADHLPRTTVMLVNITRDSKRGDEGHPLGLAVPSRSFAYVFVNRVMDVARTKPVDVGVVLGRVIAHEIGHVLLPPDRHASYGLMRGALDFGFANPNRFTEDQARSIQERLVTLTARISAARAGQTSSPGRR